ncbi:MAG TPA: acyloxyacyl hydrolase [Silvibacterium sp.]|nr:acyloxyacyl hydrolase [Silvibacterium sp.]
MHSFRSVALFALLLSASSAFSQAAPDQPPYTRLNTFGIFGEYSNDSSSILLGTSQNRKLLDFGGFYTRRVLLNHFVDGQYMLELRPIMLESDPLFHETTVVISPPPTSTFTDDAASSEACHPFSKTFTNVVQGVTFSEAVTITCDRRQWTFGEGLSPFGFKWNFLPRHCLQPVLTTLAGYMFTTKPIPIATAGSWNFTLEAGVGLEFYRSATRSIRVEYLYHHISNNYTAMENPGIDNQMVQITYAFGH